MINIKLDQNSITLVGGVSGPLSATDQLEFGAPVTLSIYNPANDSILNPIWSFDAPYGDKPEDSLASLLTPFTSVSGFTPDAYGTYLISLRVTVNGVFQTLKIGAAVKTANLYYRIPATTESDEFDNGLTPEHGWGPAIKTALQLIDDGYGAAVYGSGADGYVTYWNGTKTVTGSPDLTFNGTIFGVGSSPHHVNSIFWGEVGILDNIDTFGPSGMGIGGTNATSISIGKSSILTTVLGDAVIDGYANINGITYLNDNLYYSSNSLQGFVIDATPASPSKEMSIGPANATGVSIYPATRFGNGIDNINNSVFNIATTSATGFSLGNGSGMATSNITSGSAALNIQAGIVSTWDSHNGIVYASTFDTTTTGALSIGTTVANAIHVGSPSVLTSTGPITASGNILPQIDDGYSLGSTAQRWKFLHASSAITLHNDAIDSIETSIVYRGIDQAFVVTSPGSTIFLQSDNSIINGQHGGGALVQAGKGGAGLGQGGWGVLSAGDGGNATASSPGGTSDGAQVFGGYGGDGSATQPGGKGGPAELFAGDGGQDNGGGGGAGGDIHIDAGAGHGASANGVIQIGINSADSITIGRISKSIVINGTTTFNAGSILANNIVPNSDDSSQLGFANLRWHGLHVGGSSVNGGIGIHNDNTNTVYTLLNYISGTPTLKATGTGLTIDSTTGVMAIGANSSSISLGSSGGVAIAGDITAGGQLTFAQALEHRITIAATTANSTDGGIFRFISGGGGPASSSAGGNGGGMQFVTGAGGMGSGIYPGGASGALGISTGNGGIGTASASSGAAGDLTIGAGVAGNNLGGGAANSATLTINGANGKDAVSSGSLPNATAGGSINITANAGGNASVVGTAGEGGSLALRTGAGGNASGAFGGATGGTLFVFIGDGGDGSVSQVAGNGGHLQIQAGNGGTDNGGGGGTGGDFVLNAGQGTGLFNDGNINIGNNIGQAVNIGRLGKNINILGNLVVDGYTISPANASVGQALIYNGSAFAPRNLSAVNISDFALADTNLHTVATFTPLAPGNYMMLIYYRVINASTGLTITVTWSDGSGAQTITPVAGAQTVGSYTMQPTYINSTSNPISISAQADAANNVFVSASIMGV